MDAARIMSFILSAIALTVSTVALVRSIRPGRHRLPKRHQR